MFRLLLRVYLLYMFITINQQIKNTTNKTGFTTIYVHLLLIFSLDMMFLIMNQLLSHEHLNISEIYGFILFLVLFIVSILTNIGLHKEKS